MKLFGRSQNLTTYIETFHPQSFEAQGLESILANAELGPGHYVHAWDARGRTNLTNVQEPTSGWQDTCFGDSGGPLLREINGQLVIVGVVSTGMDRICSSFGTKFTVFSQQVQILMKQLGI
ncbi:trypsin-like serine protease [Bdellovibrio sp. HCB337]|uniref:trypsin-like serine protease n=1 Tax=Bdellovibrio sp. HCB337 TaxID=3394358 RepID=UPI0039A463D4